MRVCPRCRSIYSIALERCGIDGTLIVEQSEDPLVGFDIDRYHVLAPIGRGAMGAVYRAKHNVLPTEHAIKVLYGNFAVNQRLIERFRREAQTIGKLKHPNIVTVGDFGTTEAGLTFLVMKLVEGETLEKTIATDGPFEPHRAARIARQIASGLGEAHRGGFVHRDMKPANIMVSNVDGMDIVKILDFGVVGMLQAAAAAKLTAAGHIVGTPSYMAPEQARTSSVTTAADLYALGCIIYEMLDGQPPFEGLGVAEVLLKHIHEKPKPLKEARGLERITMWLLEKDPEKRPMSAMRVIAELDRLALGTANTEQILISRVKVDQRDASEFDRTAPVRIFPDPASGDIDFLDRSEHDTADGPIRSLVSEAARRDPSGDDAPRLVAPPLIYATMPPGEVPLTTSAATVLEGDTQVDVRLTERPSIDEVTPPLSISAVDTVKPIERVAELVDPTPLINAKDPERALLAMMQSETVRDAPLDKRPVRAELVPVSSVNMWLLLLLLLMALLTMMIAMLYR